MAQQGPRNRNSCVSVTRRTDPQPAVAPNPEDKLNADTQKWKRENNILLGVECVCVWGNKDQLSKESCKENEGKHRHIWLPTEIDNQDQAQGRTSIKRTN